MCRVWGVRREYRRLCSSVFRVVVLFTYDDTEVLVVAFAHGRRKPGYWLK